MKRKGLSLIEILISLAILTVIMIATMPMVTVKTKKYLESNDTGIWAQRANDSDPMHLQTSGEIQGGAANNLYPNLIVGATDTAAQVNLLNPSAAQSSTILTADKSDHEGRLIVYNRGLANRDLPAINIAKILYFYNNIINASGKNTLTITNNAAAAEEGYLTLGENSLNIRNRLIVQKPDAGGNIVISNKNIIQVGSEKITLIGHARDNNILQPNRQNVLYILAGRANNDPVVEADNKMIRIHGTLTIMNAANDALATITTRQVYAISDKRLKNIKGEYKKGLKEVMKIQPVEFTYKADSEKKLNIGVIAQELKKIFPEAVTKRDDGYYMVKESPVFYALLNSVKELNSNYEKIKKNNDELEKQIAHLKQKNE